MHHQQDVAPTAPAGARMLPTQRRAAAINPATFDAAARTVDVVWTTGARVRRTDWWTGQQYDEELVVSEDAVDMGRLASGAAPVLNAHRAYDLESQIGVVTAASIRDGQGLATVQLSDREDVAGIVRDIQAGIIRNVSVGYNVRRYEITSSVDRADKAGVPLYRAVAWEPAELSFVPIPADHLAGTRAGTDSSTPCEFVPAASATRSTITTTRTTMDPIDTGATANTQPATAPATEVVTDQRGAHDLAATAADITELCVRHGVPQLAAGLIRSGNGLDAARAAVLNELAVRDAAAGGHRNVGRVQTVRDEMTTRMAGIEQAVMHRVDPTTKLDDNGRQYRSQSLLQIGADLLEAQGINVRGMSRMDLAGRILHSRAGMHTVGDFANVLGNVATKRLRDAYDQNPGTYTRWARQAPNAPDFKSMSVVQLSAAPELLRTNEHGEFTYGVMKDGAESYAVVTYGRIVAITRQAIVNDDLRAFDRLATAYGFSARRLENALVYSQLTSNPTMSDTGALFNATAVTTAGGHANLHTGGGSALQASALVTARTSMRLKVGLNGELLNLAPAYLLVPASLEQTAYQLTSSSYVPATTATINEFRQGGRTALEPIVEPLLDATSTAYWYLAADTSQIDTVEYCYLDGATGPVIESDIGFEVDGVAYKCRLDFGAKVVDWRGLSRSNGA